MSLAKNNEQFDQSEAIEFSFDKIQSLIKSEQLSDLKKLISKKKKNSVEEKKLLKPIINKFHRLLSIKHGIVAPRNIKFNINTKKLNILSAILTYPKLNILQLSGHQFIASYSFLICLENCKNEDELFLFDLKSEKMINPYLKKGDILIIPNLKYVPVYMGNKKNKFIELSTIDFMANHIVENESSQLSTCGYSQIQGTEFKSTLITYPRRL